MSFSRERQSFTEVADDDEEHYTRHFTRYEATSEKVRRRLALVGFSLSKCQDAFEENRNGAIIELEAELADAESSEDDEFERARRQNRLSQLRIIDFSRWRDCLRWLLDNDRFEIFEYTTFEPGDPVEEFSELFSDDNEEFPTNLDIRISWAAVLSTFQSTVNVVLDVSELIEQGYFEDSYRFVAEGWNQLRHGIAENEPVLVLTEGPSDVTILKKSLAALYPEVEERFQFLEFGAASKHGGGAPSLVTQIKGFVAAGIRMRVLGVVDNDTAARDALKSLRDVTLPSNVAVITLPALDLANNYPTRGAFAELLYGNVNEQAVSSNSLRESSC